MSIIARVSVPVSGWATGATGSSEADAVAPLDMAFQPLFPDGNPIHQLAQLSRNEMDAEVELRRGLLALAVPGEPSKGIASNGGSDGESDRGDRGESGDGGAPSCKLLERTIRRGRERIRSTLHRYEELRRERDEVLASNSTLTTQLKFASQSILHACNECGGMDTPRARLSACAAEVDDILQGIEAQAKEQAKELDAAVAECAGELRRLSGAYAVLRSTTSEYSCPVCMIRPVGKFIIPCGHTFCSDCVSKMQRHECYMCRMRVDRVQPLFYSS